MSSVFDRYSWQARVLPVYMTISPIILALAAILPHGLDLQLGAATAIVFVPLAFLTGQVGADFGKRLEKRLWLQWDGPPTTRFLRHSNDEFNLITRKRVHTKLRSLGLDVPSADDQRRDPQAADAHWEACTEEAHPQNSRSQAISPRFQGPHRVRFSKKPARFKAFRLATLHRGFVWMSVGGSG